MNDNKPSNKYCDVELTCRNVLRSPCGKYSSTILGSSTEFYITSTYFG